MLRGLDMATGSLGEGLLIWSGSRRLLSSIPDIFCWRTPLPTTEHRWHVSSCNFDNWAELILKVQGLASLPCANSGSSNALTGKYTCGSSHAASCKLCAAQHRWKLFQAAAQCRARSTCPDGWVAHTFRATSFVLLFECCATRGPKKLDCNQKEVPIHSSSSRFWAHGGTAYVAAPMFR